MAWVPDIVSPARPIFMPFCGRKLMKTRGVSCTAGVILLVGNVLWAASEMPSWWETQREVVAILLEQRTDLAHQFEQVNASPPGTCRDAMFKLSVLLRAGVDRAAVDAVEGLRDRCRSLNGSEIQAIYYEACDAYAAWEVARRLVETFAADVSDLTIENRLLVHFQEAGWSIDDIDRWLADRPPGREGFWVIQRVRFNNVHGRAEGVIRDLQEQIQQSPEDMEAVLVFLNALIYARHGNTDRWDLSWMANTIKPALTTQAERIGAKLKELRAWGTAVAFYRQAIDVPLTEDEVMELARNRQVFVSPDTLRAHFALQVREAMAECLLEMGRADEAQKWMVEAADIRARHNLGLNALLAGRVQGASGQRVIEGRIEEEQARSEDDPEYWRERAGYYRGRNEPDLEEEALKKALALTTPQPAPEQASKGYVDYRRRLLSDYAYFLKRMNRIPEAVSLLRCELEQAPASSASAEGAANLLAFEFPTHAAAEDEVLWTWLGRRPKWEHTEQRLLWRMLENSPRDAVDGFFSRAEGLGRGQDPSRSHTLGWIMNRMDFAKRSMPLLEYAVEHAPDARFREEAVFTLFESCLDTGDWKRGEEILPEAADRLSLTELPQWYGRLAVIAATAGAKADAMRLWRAAANIDLTQLGHLSGMAKAGLRAELADFYTEMARKIPASRVPDKALKMLQLDESE